jgi:hypothetical protein
VRACRGAHALTSLPGPPRCRCFVGGADSETDRGRSSNHGSRYDPRVAWSLHAVTYETEMIIADCWQRYGGETDSTRRWRHLEPIGRYYGWRPARPVVQWSVGQGRRVTVHFIGAGPGSADLLTLRAVRTDRVFTGLRVCRHYVEIRFWRIVPGRHDRQPAS